MKKFITVITLMLISPLVYGHPGHAEGSLSADAAHLLLGLVFVAAVFGAGLLAVRAFDSIRSVRQ
jgi:hydrogenase/urease accessory protein HupE